MEVRYLVTAALLCGTVVAGESTAAQRAATAKVLGYRVVRTYPHDPSAFTQGLQYIDGTLYESTGLNGRSEIRKVNLTTGAVLQRRALEAEFFGEGIVVFGDRLFQLTWKAQKGFIYRANTFERLRSFEYRGEGWGLTHDGRHLIMSDGSAELRFWDPQTLEEVRRLKVHDGARPVLNLNELEFVRGEILANVWQSNRIARIDPKSGAVTSWLDLAGLLPARQSAGADVLNGIAYDAAGDRLFVTGKLWPALFEIKIVPRD